MHPQIDDQEIIERYARNQLAPEEKREFEEHFFSCETCFEKLQATERFIAGIGDAARRGMLAQGAGQRTGEWPLSSWWIPAFAASLAAALVFASLAGWQYFVQIPKMRSQLSHTAAELTAEQQGRAALEEQLLPRRQPAGNVPFVMLQATRDAQAKPAEAILPAGAAQLVLWVDVDSRYETYRLEIYDMAGKPIETLEHLSRNAYGALAAGLPGERLQPGEFQIKLFGENPLLTPLLAEYRLRIRRP